MAEDKEITQTCTKCGVDKPLAEFCNRNTTGSRHGKRYDCRACRKLEKLDVKLRKKIDPLFGVKTCKKCNRTKAATEVYFRKDDTINDGFAFVCNHCVDGAPKAPPPDEVHITNRVDGHVPRPEKLVSMTIADIAAWLDVAEAPVWEALRSGALVRSIQDYSWTQAMTYPFDLPE